MDKTEISQNADFLSIALEEMSYGNYGTAEGFVEDVYENLVEELDE